MDQQLVVHAAGVHRRLGLFHAGHHPRQRAQTTHLGHLAELHAQVVHVELALGHFRSELVGFVLVDDFRRPLDQTNDVAHAEDAARNALRVERFDSVQLFANTREFDRFAGNRAHRKRRTAARIAVHTGQHDTGQINPLAEILGDIDGILARQRVHDEQYFLRRRNLRHRLHFVHQLLVDVEASSRIEQQHIKALQLCGLHRALGDVDGLLPLHDRQGRDFGLRSERCKLLLRGRAVNVERRHQDLFALLRLQHLRDFRGRGGFTRALQTDHHDDRRRRNRQIQVALLRTQHLDERIVDDLDDLLAGSDRFQDRLANGLFGRLVHKFPNNWQGHVGFQQSDAHFAHCFADISLVQRTATTQAVKHPP